MTWFLGQIEEVGLQRQGLPDGADFQLASKAPHGHLEGLRAIQNFDYLDRLPTIKIPTLVICGDDDPATPPDRNRLIASKIPGARYEDIAKARHLPNVERPEPFNRLMLSFLGLNR